MNAAYVESMARDGRPPRGREGRHHRRRHHVREEDLLRRRRPQRPDPGRHRRTRREFAEGVREVKAQLRRLETLGKPVVAGDQRRGARRRPRDLPGHATTASSSTTRRSQLGFPEVQLGLLPGGGGVVRTVRMLGIVDALMKLLLQGKRYRPDEGAWRSASSTRSCDTPDELIPAAKKWIAENPEAAAALGRQGLQDPRRHAVEPEARGEPAGLPGQPAQAAQGRELPGAAQHHGRGRRGRAGRLRHRASRSRAATSSTSSPARSRRT